MIPDGSAIRGSIGRSAIEHLDRGIRVAAAAALFLTLGAWFGGKYWPLELLTHFRMQFLAGAVALLAVALVRRCFGSAFVALLVATASVVDVLPYVMPGPIDAQAGLMSMRIMSANVNLRNRDYDAVFALIVRENPDIVGLLEVDGAWTERMSGLGAKYPFSVLRPEDGAYGLALYSRFPIREVETTPYLQDGTQTAVSVELEMQDLQATLTLAHLMAPTSAAKARLRNLQIEKIIEMVRADRGHEQIVIGDLNVTPWSPYYAPLEKEAGLVNAAKARGYFPTWPTGFSLLKIPIDHVLLSDGFRVQQFRTGAGIGSDHLPIVVDIEIAGRRVDETT